MSPVRSMAAVSLGFGLFTQIFGCVGASALAGMLPGEFPAQPDENTLAMPTEVGLIAMTLMNFANATLAGLIAGRVARFMPFLHGLVLAGILGLFAATSMDQVRGFPRWFALGYLALPALGATLGGWLAQRTERTKAKTFVSETVVTRAVSSEPPVDDGEQES